MKPFLTFVLTTICTLGSFAAWAGPGAPSGNPQIELFELPDGSSFSTGYNIDDVLTYSPIGRYGWTLEAKYTPLGSFRSEGVKVAPDGKTLLLVGGQVLEVRDLASGARRFTARISDANSPQAQLGEFAFSPDNTRVVISGIARIGQPRLRVFDVRSGQMLQEFSPPHAAETLSWTGNTQVEIKWDAAEAKIGEWHTPQLAAQTFEVALAPEKFVPAKLSAAGAESDAPAKVAPKKRVKRKTSKRRTRRTSRRAIRR